MTQELSGKEKAIQFYYKKNKLQQLKGFCYVCQTGSVKEAAERMGLQASAVSTQITSLESELGIKLFDRENKKNLIMTPDGKALYVKAIDVVQRIDNIFDEFLYEHDFKYQNRMVIASFDEGIRRVIAPVVQFKKKHPAMEISFLNIQKDEAMEKLKKNEADILFYPFSNDELVIPEVKNIYFEDYKSYFMMRKNSRFLDCDFNNSEDIAKCKFCFIPELVTIKSFRDFIDKNEIKNQIYTENCNIDVLKALVYEFDYISIASDIYIREEDRKSFNFVDTTNFFKKRSYYFSINKHAKTLTNDLVKYLLKNFKIE